MVNWKFIGYDGVIVDFLKKYWYIMGVDMIRVVLGFFNFGFLFEEINKMMIVFILKREDLKEC